MQTLILICFFEIQAQILKCLFPEGPTLLRICGGEQSDCEGEYSIDLGQFIFCCPRWVALGEIASLSPVIVA